MSIYVHQTQMNSHQPTAMASSTRAFSVDYTLYPPPIESETEQPIASSSKLPPKTANSSFPIPIPTFSANSQPQRSGSETSVYYSSLSLTLKQAQKELNDTLTLWKDAIGDREKSKEDPGTIGFGRGKAAVMSEDVRGEIRGQNQVEGEGEGDSDSSDEA